MSAQIASEADGTAREQLARAFFVGQGIVLPSDWDRERVIKVYDRVRQVPIGKDCEQFASDVYKFAFKYDGRLAYTKQEMGKYTGGQFDIQLTDRTPYAAKAYRQWESDC